MADLKKNDIVIHKGEPATVTGVDYTLGGMRVYVKIYDDKKKKYKYDQFYVND
jgi:hypothetical protein